MEDWRENLSIISRLKIAGKQADALSARLFFERLFGSANFHPPGIPARSVVCIRKINAPPFKNYRPDFGTANLALDWETGIRREVEKSSRRAFRPIRETVPANAESVVFEDRAEMLACLAQDWLGGALAEHWWWRALFTRLFSTEMPFKIWLAAAEFAPSGLHILSKKAAADKFVGKLEPPQACELLREIIRIFGLAKLSAALLSEPLGKKALSSAQSIVKGAGKKRFRSDENLTSLTKSDALFRSLIPESEAAELSFEQQVLLETGLLLARSPRVARSPEFAERVKAVRTKTEDRKAFKETPPFAIFEQNKPLQMSVAALETNQRKARADGENQIKQSRPANQKNETFDLQTTGEVESASEKPPFGLITKRESAQESRVEPKNTGQAKPAAKIEFEAAKPEKNLPASEQKAQASDEKFIKPGATGQLFENLIEAAENVTEFSFQTRYGGVFYLLNLGLYLRLYRDFTEELPAEIDLNIWDFVALLGLELLGEQIKTDAVWDFLKRAAERENDADFGHEFDQSRDWRMPPEWLAAYTENQPWIWAKQKNRLVVRHADGFNVIDVLMRGVAETRLKNELKNYTANFSRIIKAGKKNLSPVKSKTWLENLAEYLQERLFRALNLRTPDELKALLFERRATVSVSPTHLEVTFALADLPIQIRLAGIDRNPAWIPAAGKFVYFHFV